MLSILEDKTQKEEKYCLPLMQLNSTAKDVQRAVSSARYYPEGSIKKYFGTCTGLRWT